MGNPEERLDIINEQDEVVGSATRAEVYEHKNMHRIVHVIIYSRDGEVLLQRRSMAVSMPNHWTTSVGGHVSAGETYVEAAHREMQEEVGIGTELTFAGQTWFIGRSGLKKCLHIFHAYHDGPFVAAPDEIAELRFFSQNQLTELLSSDALVSPELRFLIEEGLI